MLLLTASFSMHEVLVSGNKHCRHGECWLLVVICGQFLCIVTVLKLPGKLLKYSFILYCSNHILFSGFSLVMAFAFVCRADAVCHQAASIQRSV